MLKKGLAVATLLAATSSVFAGGPEAPPPAYIGGIYVDVGLSRDDVHNYFRKNFYYTNIATGVATNAAQQRFDAGADGWSGFFGVGYNYVWDNEWSLGLEIFGDFSNASRIQWGGNTVNLITGQIGGQTDGALPNSSQVNLRMNNTFGISLLPGYYVAPGSLYYLELGYVDSEFQVNGFPGVAPLSYWGLANRNVNEGGFRLGFGTRTQVGDHVAVGQEYIWETYGNFRTVSSAANLAVGNFNINSTNVVRFSPEVERYTLSAQYYFARQGNGPDLSTAPAHVGGHWYLGLNGSRDEAVTKALLRGVRTTTITDGVITADSSANEYGLWKIYGWDVGLFGGYGWNFPNRWYLGAELFTDYDSVSGNYSTGTTAMANNAFVTNGAAFNSQLQKQWDFGVALIPGYQVSDAALLYARVGYIGAQYRLRVNSGDNVQLDTVAQNLADTFSRTKWLSGLQLGAGVDTVVYENLSLRTEFDINNYGNYNVNNVVFNQASDARTTLTRTVSHQNRRIIEDSFNVALIWHFFE